MQYPSGRILADEKPCNVILFDDGTLTVNITDRCNAAPVITIPMGHIRM